MTLPKRVFILTCIALLYATAMWREQQQPNTEPVETSLGEETRKLSSEDKASKQIVTLTQTNQSHSVSQDNHQEKIPAVLYKKEPDNDAVNMAFSPTDDVAQHNTRSNTQKLPRSPIKKRCENEGGILINSTAQKKRTTYRVKEKDTLWGIAAHAYGVKSPQKINKCVSAIIKSNACLRQNPDKILAGMDLYIPSIKTIFQSSQFALPTSHEIAEGETLSSLADYYYQDRQKWLLILDANPGINPNQLVCGVKLTIPRYRGDN